MKEAFWGRKEYPIYKNTYVNDYITSGEVSLDCLDGDVFIALKYLGGDSVISTTYDVDNFKIIGD